MMCIFCVIQSKKLAEVNKELSDIEARLEQDKRGERTIASFCAVYSDNMLREKDTF